MGMMAERAKSVNEGGRFMVEKGSKKGKLVP
jgi:hypothetical protein